MKDKLPNGETRLLTGELGQADLATRRQAVEDEGRKPNFGSIWDQVTSPDGRSGWEIKREIDEHRRQEELTEMPAHLAELAQLKDAVLTRDSPSDPERIKAAATALEKLLKRPDAGSSDGKHFDAAMGEAFDMFLTAIKCGAFQEARWLGFRHAIAQHPNVGSIGVYFRLVEPELVDHLNFRWSTMEGNPRWMFCDGIKIVAILLQEEANWLKRQPAPTPPSPGLPSASPPAQAPRYIPHAIAYAMLNITSDLDAKQKSKIMERIRKKAGNSLICSNPGNKWHYELESWISIVSIISASGGIDQWENGSGNPQEIELRKSIERAKKPRE